MSRLNHYLCDSCWNALAPGYPARGMDSGDELPCCRCRMVTRSGIWYLSAEPTWLCHGRGPVHQPEEGSR